MTSLERRTLLKGGLAAAAIGGPFAGFVNSPAGAASRFAVLADATLVPVRDERDGRIRLHLPEGFSYRSFHDTSQPVELDDGTVLPGRHDGMGAFGAPGGPVTLVRNHEVNGHPGAFGPATAPTYDTAAGGGNTTIEVTGEGVVLADRTALRGTMMNCSGGIMPWGSWITCEETVNGPDVAPDFTGVSNVELQEPHGYIFEVPANGTATAQPITSAGRFSHEAVAWESGHLYLTEDNFAFASGYYRYKPATDPMTTGRLDNDGTLEMLAVKGERNAHLEGEQIADTTYDVEWIPIKRPNHVYDYVPGEEAPTANDTALTQVGRQGWAKGAAYFSRLEGQAAEGGVVFFTSTQGGGAPEKGRHDPGGYGNGRGQVWAYDTENETLTCVYQSPGPDTLDFPDNVTTRNGTVILCEDGSNANYVRALTPDGKLVNIALNRLNMDDADPGNDRPDDEFAGSTFSPDGETLFVNIQASRGISFAIWGPWESLGI